MWRYITYLYTLFHIKRKLNNLEIIGDIQIDPNKPLLVLANHFSLWDGFIALVLCKRQWNKEFHFLINQKEFEERPFLRKIGGLGLHKNSKALLKDISTASEILKKPESCLLHYPQNQFESTNTSSPRYYDTIVKRLDHKDAQIIFLHNIVEFENHFKPSFYIYLKEIDGFEDIDSLHQENIARHKEIIANKHVIK